MVAIKCVNNNAVLWSYQEKCHLPVFTRWHHMTEKHHNNSGRNQLDIHQFCSELQTKVRMALQLQFLINEVYKKSLHNLSNMTMSYCSMDIPFFLTFDLLLHHSLLHPTHCVALIQPHVADALCHIHWVNSLFVLCHKFDVEVLELGKEDFQEFHRRQDRHSKAKEGRGAYELTISSAGWWLASFDHYSRLSLFLLTDLKW